MKLEETINDLVKIVETFCYRNQAYVNCFDSFEDMVSECLLRCITYFNTYDENRGALSTWAFLECRAICNYHFKKLKRRNWLNKQERSLDDKVTEDGATKLDILGETLDIDSKLKQLDDKKLIKILQENFCQELKDYLNGHSLDEQAKRYNVTPSEISRRICVNRRKLKKIVKDIADGTYNTYIRSKDIHPKIMQILNCSKRTAHRHIAVYIKTGYCRKEIKHLFENKIVKRRGE